VAAGDLKQDGNQGVIDERSWRTLSYFKGIAILSVLVAHYGLYFAYDFYHGRIDGYANGIISIFFVAAGFAIYHSLEKRAGTGAIGPRKLARFYFDRAMRILPLYWIALIITPFYYPEFASLQHFSLKTLAVFIGFPFIRAPGVFWFITAILQCYLVAPFMYLALKRLGTNGFLKANLIAGGFLLLATYGIFIFQPQIRDNLETSSFINSFFYKDRDFVLANLLLFSLGMSIVPVIKSYGEHLKRLWMFFASAGIFAFSVYFTRRPDTLFRNSAVFIMYLLVASSYALCLTAITSRPPLPLGRILDYIGAHSYPQYLYHLTFFGVLARFGIINSNRPLSSALLTAALYPLFLLLSAGIELYERSLVSMIRRR
jgi:peptidoglycan/LPS O-acetylase OafA/YrhL